MNVQRTYSPSLNTEPPASVPRLLESERKNERKLLKIIFFFFFFVHIFIVTLLKVVADKRTTVFNNLVLASCIQKSIKKSGREREKNVALQRRSRVNSKNTKSGENQLTL